jgi:hypothetical protein
MRFASNGFAPVVWAALGSGATLAIQRFGQAALDSGWTATACAGGLLAAAGGVVLQARAVTGRKGRAGGAAPSFVRPAHPEWDIALTPAAWILASGTLDVPEAEVEGFLHGKLAGSLTPLPRTRQGGWEFALPEPVALLALAFAARIDRTTDAGGRETAAALLAALGRAHALPSPEARAAALSGIRASAADGLGYGGRIARAYLDRIPAHGTRETFLLGLLSAARRNGVLACGEFAWLKAVDRPLWYALSNLGRRSFLVEGLAAMDHYRSEVDAGRAIRVPQVRGAAGTMSALCREMRAERDGKVADAGEGRA